MTGRPVVLIIMDGWGHNPGDPFNAVEKARTPFVDAITAEYPSTTIKCMGPDVGLPDGVMGNSEVGHLNLGAGRIVWQDIARINNAIEDESFFENEALLGAVKHAVENGTRLHLTGLLSRGNVHAAERQYFALIDLAAKHGLSGDRVLFHAFTDGRDTPPTSGLEYMNALEAHMKKTGTGRVATVTGRFYAMDRDKNWNFIEQAWRGMAEGKGARAASAADAIQHYYDYPSDPRSMCGDEFITPTVIAPAEGSTAYTLADGNAFIFFNYRTDRGRELSHALLDADFPHFQRSVQPQLHYVTLTEYEKSLPVTAVAFPPKPLDDTVAQMLSERKLRQFHAAETQKYPHVTFFFNGGVEEMYPGEDRLLVPSLKEVTFDRWPQMSAGGIMDGVLQAINGRRVSGAVYHDGQVPAESRTYDFIVVNFANGDMVGHTGDMDACIRACESVDYAVAAICEALQKVGGAAIVTADHGNSDDLWDEENDCRHTAHSLNPVPLIVFDERYKNATLRGDGRLADVIPTALEMLGIKPSDKMDGKSLIKKSSSS